MSITAAQFSEAMELLTRDPATRKLMRDHLEKLDAVSPDTRHADAETRMHRQNTAAGLSPGMARQVQGIELPNHPTARKGEDLKLYAPNLARQVAGMKILA